MTAARLRIVLLADAAFSAAIGVIMLAGTWDELYDKLDFPQGQPSFFVQIGGAVLVGVAYLLWVTARTPALMVPVARAAAVMSALSVAIIVAWLIHGKLGLDTQGKVELVASGVLLSGFTVAYVAAGLRSGGYGPEPPPTP